MSPPEELTDIRERIEQLDRALLGLLKERMGLMESVAQAKLRSAAPFRDPLREEQVLQRVRRSAVELGLEPNAAERIFRDVMEMAIARQQAHVAGLTRAPLRVAYPGVEGSECHLAARKRYAGHPEGVLLVSVTNVREAVEAVRDGQADRALLAIESTRAGSLEETYDLVANAGLAFTAEVITELEHHLLGLPGATAEGLRTVLVDPESLRQCAAFLSAHPLLAVQTVEEAADGARRVLKTREPSLGVIGSASAVRLFGLKVLIPDVDGAPSHAARFVEIAREPLAVPAGSRCKTSLWLELEHKPGALGEVLARFSRHGVNLTKIESRPIPGEAWRYRFFLDVEAPGGEEGLTRALEEIRPLSSALRSLGTYPVAEKA